MQVVLIDTFTVAEASKAELVEQARGTAKFLRTLPGCVEGYIYEKTDGDRNDVVTTAVWQDQGSSVAALTAMSNEHVYCRKSGSRAGPCEFERMHGKRKFRRVGEQ